MKIYIVSIPLMPCASIFFIYWHTTPTIRSEYRESCTFRTTEDLFRWIIYIEICWDSSRIVCACKIRWYKCHRTMRSGCAHV